MTKIEDVFNQIWLRTKLSHPEATFIKKGDVELLIEEKGFVMSCKAKDLQNTQLNK